MWRGKIGNELAGQIQRESQELGVEVHKAIEEKFNACAIGELTPNAQRMLDNFWNKFVVPWEVKPVVLEQTYKNETLKLQGTVDGILRTKKGVFVTDFKTSNQLDDISIKLQLTMYALLSGHEVWDGLGVRIDKKLDKVQIKEYKDLKQYLPVVYHAIGLARYVKFGEVGNEG